MELKTGNLKVKLVLGCVSLVIGLLAANLALFHWVERTGIQYLLGEYSRYVCAYGGFGAIVFGAMLINDFVVFRKISRERYQPEIKVAAGVEMQEEVQTTARAKGNRDRNKMMTAITTGICVLLLSPIAFSIVSYTSTAAITPALHGPQTLYAHEEDCGSLHYFRLYAADAAGTTKSAQTNSTGRKSMGCFIYELTDVATINASTWTFYYRTQKSHSDLSAHCDADILVKTSNGTVRATVAADVANSSELTTSWSTLSATYVWTQYSVVDQTDYLEVDYYVDVTVEMINESVCLRIDDNTLAPADQTRVVNVIL
jgi:hypothetical protein